MPQEITAEERATVMRLVMATIELEIPQGIQDALVMLARQGIIGRARMVEQVRAAAGWIVKELMTFPLVAEQMPGPKTEGKL